MFWIYEENPIFGKKIMVILNVDVSETILNAADISPRYQSVNYQLQVTEM